MIVVGIGPKAQAPKHRLVLAEIAGENLLFVDDYASLDNHTDDMIKLICRKYHNEFIYLFIYLFK